MDKIKQIETMAQILNLFARCEFTLSDSIYMLRTVEKEIRRSAKLEPKDYTQELINRYYKHDGGE